VAPETDPHRAPGPRRVRRLAPSAAEPYKGGVRSTPRWLLLGVALTGASLWGPLGRAEEVLPPRELRVGLAGLPPAVEPGTALEGPAALAARQVFDTLVAYRDTTTDIEPALATRWQVSRDGLLWTFALREDVRFHDGTPLTAADVVASFQRLLRLGPPHTTVWAALLRGVPGVVREVRAVDPRTVQIALVQPYAPLLTALAHPGFGVVREAPGVGLVGTGPFRIAESAGGRIVLEAVPAHWAGPPRSSRLVFLEVATEEHATAEMASGGLDVWFPPGPPRRPSNVLSVPGLHVGYLALQTEKEPFSRKPIRQAVAGAIDPGMLAIALGQAAIPLQGFLPPGVWARREGPPVLGGTREAVVRLLKAGQWPPGFTATLLVPGDAGTVDMAALGEVLRVSLETSGVPVTLRVEPAQVTAAIREAGEHDLVVAEAAVAGGDPHLLLYPLSTSEGAIRGRRPLNYSFYRNPRLDDVLIRASQLAFRPERFRLYQRAQALLADELPWVPLYVKLLWAVVRPEVRGLRLHPTGLHRLATVSVGPPAAPF
jgi:peptide/nickel transport system substrate-binding protein